MNSTTSHNKASLWAVGLMLFALFFGAGNLIFPAFLGQQAGENWLSAMFGFLLTGAGLPLLGVIAVGYSGSRDVEALASRVAPWYGVTFATALYLAIGPLFAMPRTATVSFETAISPFIGESWKNIALAVFSLVFFGMTYWLSISPGKLVDRIGKILTPVLLLSIAILVGYAAINPMGMPQAAQGDFATHPLVKGILEGYGTMDALASLVFAIIGYMGATGVAGIGLQENGASVLSKTAQHYFGTAGIVLLGVMVLLACLSTAVGLITSCAEYFNRLYPGISYKIFVILNTVVSILLANKGLSAILQFSIPMLMLLYPLTIVIILLALTDKLFGGGRIVYFCTMMAALMVGLLDAYKAAFGFDAETAAAIERALPFYNIGLGWVVPSLACFILGCILNAALKKKA